jgi:hypothetical protein
MAVDAVSLASVVANRTWRYVGVLARRYRSQVPRIATQFVLADVVHLMAWRDVTNQQEIRGAVDANVPTAQRECTIAPPIAHTDEQPTARLVTDDELGHQLA